MAVTLTAGNVRDALDFKPSQLELAGRLLAVAAALVTRFAPTAPEPVQNEAALRCIGWLSEAPASGVRSQKTGPFEWDYSPHVTGALRASGAMSLLGPWKVRRAGAIGGSA